MIPPLWRIWEELLPKFLFLTCMKCRNWWKMHNFMGAFFHCDFDYIHIQLQWQTLSHAIWLWLASMRTHLLQSVEDHRLGFYGLCSYCCPLVQRKLLVFEDIEWQQKFMRFLVFRNIHQVYWKRNNVRIGVDFGGNKWEGWWDQMPQSSPCYVTLSYMVGHSTNFA